MLRNDSCTEEPLALCHATPPTTHLNLHLTIQSHFTFVLLPKKLISIPQILSSTSVSYLYEHEQICPAPSVLMPSLHPLANPFPVPLTHALSPHAAPATRPSSAAMMSLYLSACSATLNSHILSFSISVLPRHSYKATSPSTNKTFSSHKNRPCSLQLRLPSRMTGSSRALTNKSRTFRHKSINLRLSRPIW